MRGGPPTAAGDERRLLEDARAGGEDAFARLVEPHRRELMGLCYRMLGSVHDAEDALQDALLRAWRGLPRFDGRSSLRTWLHRIATNVCLDVIARRPKRLLAFDQSPPTDPSKGPGAPTTESVWIGPCPDDLLGLDDEEDQPGASYERREGVELAFVAALQHLSPTQRAVLILREVLGFSAREVAETLETSVASVNSLLQRARKASRERLPERSQQSTLRALGDRALRTLVGRYVEAWERGDVPAVVAMLTEDAAITMPPLASWFRGREAIARFLEGWPLSGIWRWRHLPARANGQPAIGCYVWDEGAGAFLPFSLEVLTVREDGIAVIDAFVTRVTPVSGDVDFARWPDLDQEPRGVVPPFSRFGLPERLEA